MQANDLVVYTAQPSWAMDKSIWQALASHVVDLPIQVTARARGAAGLTAASTASFTIAPVPAGGQLVYWALRGFDASNSANTELFGFAVGDESVVSVLKVPQIQQTASGVSIGCIGCHTATPDGAFVGFTGFYPWPNALASVEPGTMGAMPDFLGTPGSSALTTDWHGIITFSGAHWGQGDRIGVTSQSTQAVDPNANLIWMELDSGSSGVLARQGDPAGAAAPNFSHDGTRIVYTSTDANQDGRLGVGKADLYRRPLRRSGGRRRDRAPGRRRARRRRVLPVVLAGRQAGRLQPAPAERRQRDTDRRALRRRHVLQPGRRGLGGARRRRRGGSPEGQRSAHLHAGRASRTRASIPTRPAGTTRGPSGRRRSGSRTRSTTTGSSSRLIATTSLPRADSST